MHLSNISILFILIFFDYLTGIFSAIYEKKINSNIGRKGILNKVGILVCVTMCKLIDMLHISGLVPILPLVLLFFIINESFSILENLKKLNVPIPDFVMSILNNVKNKFRKK